VRHRRIQRFRRCKQGRSRHLPATIVRSRVFAAAPIARIVRGSGDQAGGRHKQAIATARLAAAVRSTSERRRRIALAGRLVRVLLMIKRPSTSFFRTQRHSSRTSSEALPSCANSVTPNPCPKRVLVVVALSNRKRKHAERMSDVAASLNRSPRGV